MRRNKQVRLFSRYILSGCAAAITHFSVLAILIEFVDFNAAIASILGFCAAIVVNYSLQYYCTFRAQGPHSVILFRYLLVTFAMLALNTLLFWTLNSKLSLHYLAAQSIATAVIMIGNFSINRRYTFVSDRKPDTGQNVRLVDKHG